MEKIGNQKIWSYYDRECEVRIASNSKIRGGIGHYVDSYFKLAMKVAELQFLNRDHVFLFRGQRKDHTTAQGSSLLKASIFRSKQGRLPRESDLKQRFHRLQEAEKLLVNYYKNEYLRNADRIERHRIIRWAIIQHYEICDTPLLDVTQSLRIAASFATDRNESEQAYVFAFGVPNISGAVTASSEAGLQIIRLSSACPPDAVRPHIQAGYLLGEYPEIADVRQKNQYKIWEVDFGRRLIAKFRFNPNNFWGSENYPKAPNRALYPADHRDILLNISDRIKEMLDKGTA